MSSDATIINREHWLNELVKRLEPMLSEHGHKLPTKWRISCGFPGTRARPSAKNAHRIGECWGADASEDNTHEMFVSPLLSDPIKVAETTYHEILHAALPPGTGHRGPFARLAKKVGLEGKPTATHAGEALVAQLTVIIEELGTYPHGALDISTNRKTRNPLLKTICPECGYIARITRMWLDEAGTPICPQCHAEFIEPDAEGAVESPLQIAEQSVEFKLRGDDRFTVRLIKRGQRGRWYVFDWGEPVPFGSREARITPAESRQDAVDLIESIKVGLLTYEELQDSEATDLDVESDGEPDPDEDWRDMTYLTDDEEEFADHPESLLTPEELEEYECEQGHRVLMA